MAFADHRHVLHPVEPEAHWAVGEGRAEGSDGGEPVGLHLLTAESAAHAQALHRDLRGAQAQDLSDDILRLRRVLSGGLDE